jgi:hypothetical protein
VDDGIKGGVGRRRAGKMRDEERLGGGDFSEKCELTFP